MRVYTFFRKMLKSNLVSLEEHMDNVFKHF